MSPQSCIWALDFSVSASKCLPDCRPKFIKPVSFHFTNSITFSQLTLALRTISSFTTHIYVLDFIILFMQPNSDYQSLLYKESSLLLREGRVGQHRVICCLLLYKNNSQPLRNILHTFLPMQGSYKCFTEITYRIHKINGREEWEAQTNP